MPAKRSTSTNNLAAPVSPALHHPSLQSQGQPFSPGHAHAPGIKPSPSLPSFTRSASPSGLSNFFTRPTKWFTRSSSSSNSSRASPVGEHHPQSQYPQSQYPQSQYPHQQYSQYPHPHPHPHPPPRVSTSTSSTSSSNKRRPTISGPTDPRPIDTIGTPGLDAKLIGHGGMGMMGMGGLVGLNDRASRSVLDLSSRASTDLVGATSSPLSMNAPIVSGTGSSGTGDLRSIARKGWSRSVDNLQIIPPSRLAPAPLNTNTTTNNNDPNAAPNLNVSTPTSVLEMKIEQYRTGTPTTPGSLSQSQSQGQGQSQKIYPFPTMPGTPTPGTPGTPSTPPSEYTIQHPHRQLRHTHSNSGSSTSASLSTPIGGGSTGGVPSPSARLAPPIMPSPQKAGRKRSFDFDRSKSNKSVDAIRTAGASGFPFFGNAHAHAHPERKNSTPVTSAPPMIVEPGGGASSSSRTDAGGGGESVENEDEGNEASNKRASQIVHRSGFILRLSNFSPSSLSSLSLSSSKNWKPFKLILKGSKLYFHKPPGDRGAAIRDLFPVGLVAVEEIEEGGEEEEKEVTGEMGRPNREREEIRKRRAFWGRRTHPDLVFVNDPISEGKKVIQKGTLEALVHEAAFGTTFDASTAEMGAEAEEKYREFASMVLFFLPSLVSDRTKFEHEFQRCASYFVSGASDLPVSAESDSAPALGMQSESQSKAEEGKSSSKGSEKDRARKRVGWLVEKYIEYYGAPKDEERWKAFCTEVVPATVVAKTTSGFGSAPSQLEPSLLDSAGFTREVFVRLEPETVSRGLVMYQRSVLESALSSSLSASGMGRGNIGADVFLGETTSNPLVEFFGCEENPHWLTRTVVMQILGPGQISQSSINDGDDNHNSSQGSISNSRTHVRAEIIARWARVGEMCRLAGDECSFRAIMDALCSKPIARLEKAWRRVDSTALGVVRSWVAAAASAVSTSLSFSHGSGAGPKGAGVEEVKTSPWGGDTRYRAQKLLEKLQEGKSNEWACEGMYDARRAFDEFVASVEKCFNSNGARQGQGQRTGEASTSEDEDALRLVQCWKELSKAPPPMKIHRINQFMSLSFAAEPKKKGLFTPYYWSRQAYHGPQVLIPLLVPELLPTMTLVDRSQLVRTKKLSYESNAVLGDSQSTRPSELIYTIEQDGRIRAGGPGGAGARRGTRGSNAFDLGGMILPVFDGELLLCVISNPEPGSSRPVSRAAEGTDSSAAAATANSSASAPSRQPSIRVKSAAAGLDRKLSSRSARRSSLPVLSQRERAPPTVVVIEPTGEPPLHAVVQAGTLDALVHFLVHGLEGVSVSVADDNGEMALCDKKTRAVRVDRAEFARVWWPAFRSFVSPYVLFQLLRKDFLSSSPKRGSHSPEEVAQAIQVRLAVIRVITEWIHTGGGALDALDDVELHSAMQSFLAQQAADSVLSRLASKSEELSNLLSNYEAERISLLNMFKAQTMRPQSRSIPVRGQSSEDTVHNFGNRPPKLEEITPSELVDNLDAMASAAFRNVNQEDLYVAADLLEVQTSDRTGWLLPREPGSGTDEVEIQSLYTFLNEVEPTSLAGEYSGETLYRLLPPGIRSLLRAFVILRKWAICSLAASQLGVKARQARMEMFLKAIEICRLRSIDSQTAVVSDANPVKQPCVRSFVEAALTSAIVGPESRMFSRVWQAVATARCTQMESILSLLSARTVELPAKKERLTVDPAWLLERMLEVISFTDVLDSPMDMDAPLSLINFDKRRQLHNIIANTSSYVSRGSRQRREMDRMDFERLNRIEQEFGDVVFDLRTLRDEAQREAASLGAPPTPSRKSAPRPFNRVVATQQEKIKRDRYLRERLMKDKRHEQQRLERKEDDLNRAMDSRNQSQSSGQKHMRGKRSMSALFSLMRPISTAFTSDSAIMPKRSAAELDFTPTHKPALVLSLVDARVTPLINNDRSFTFQIDTEDGGHYLLQALSKSDMHQWMQTISTAIRSHAQRRLTYMGNSSPIQVADQAQPGPATASRDPKAVFGVDLTFLVRREAGGEDPPSDAIPSVLELCLKEIEERGLTEQGIYRVAGATSEVNALREALNIGQRHIDRYTDINAVAGVVKYWFRNLPETVIPEPYFEPIIEAARAPDLDERLAKIRKIVHTFPRAHFSVLKRLAEHMDRVVDYEEQNHMTPDNLAVVVCPNILRAPNNNFGLIMANMGPMTVLFKALVTHMHFIFDENVEEGEEGDEEEEIEDDEEKAQVDSLFVPEPDLGRRFVISPEPDELPQDAGASPDR